MEEGLASWIVLWSEYWFKVNLYTKLDGVQSPYLGLLKIIQLIAF